MRHCCSTSGIAETEIRKNDNILPQLFKLVNSQATKKYYFSIDKIKFEFLLHNFGLLL